MNFETGCPYLSISSSLVSNTSFLPFFTVTPTTFLKVSLNIWVVTNRNSFPSLLIIFTNHQPLYPKLLDLAPAVLVGSSPSPLRLVQLWDQQRRKRCLGNPQHIAVQFFLLSGWWNVGNPNSPLCLVQLWHEHHNLFKDCFSLNASIEVRRYDCHLPMFILLAVFSAHFPMCHLILVFLFLSDLKAITLIQHRWVRHGCKCRWAGSLRTVLCLA